MGHSPEQPAPDDPTLELGWTRQFPQVTSPLSYSVFCHLLGCKALGIVLSKQEHSTTDLCSAQTPEKQGLSQATLCTVHSTEKAASKFTGTYNPLLVREWKHKQPGQVKGFAHTNRRKTSLTFKRPRAREDKRRTQHGLQSGITAEQ